MSRMAGLGARLPLCARAGWLFRIRWIRRGGTIGGAGGLREARFKRGDPRGLLLDDGEQLDDQLAHDKQGLFPIGRVK